MAMRGEKFPGLSGEHYARAYCVSGIPEYHHTAPYAMTEEFTAVYRMHSLLPDAFSFRPSRRRRASSPASS